MKGAGYVPRQRYAILAYWSWVRPGVTSTVLAEKTGTSDRQLRRDLRQVPSVVCIPDGRINRYFHRETEIPCTRLPTSPLAPVSVALVQTGLCYAIDTGTTMQAVTDLAPVAGWSLRETEQGTRIATCGPVTFQITSQQMLVCSDEPALLPAFADVLRNAFACYESAHRVAAALSPVPKPGRLIRDEWTSVVVGTGAAAAVRDACLPYAGGDRTLLIPSQDDRPAFFITTDGDRSWLTTTAATPRQQHRAGAFHAELRSLLATGPDDLCRFFGEHLLPDAEPGADTERTTTLCEELTPTGTERQIGDALGISTGAASAFLASFALWARSGYRQTLSFGTVVEGLLARGTRPCTSTAIDGYVQELETAGLCRRDAGRTLRFTPEGIRLGRRIGSLARCA